MNAPLALPLPRDWQRHVKRALAVAVGLERLALLEVRAGFEHSLDPRAQLVAELDAAREQCAVLAAQCRLLRARLSRVPAPRRPQYEPCERLAILTLRSRAGWSAARTASEFLLTPKTVASWTARRVCTSRPAPCAGCSNAPGRSPRPTRRRRSRRARATRTKALRSRPREP
jgi:hypothetical protein